MQTEDQLCTLSSLMRVCDKRGACIYRELALQTSTKNTGSQQHFATALKLHWLKLERAECMHDNYNVTPMKFWPPKLPPSHPMPILAPSTILANAQNWLINPETACQRRCQSANTGCSPVRLEWWTAPGRPPERCPTASNHASLAAHMQSQLLMKIQQ